jgi:hypothetical protein
LGNCRNLENWGPEFKSRRCDQKNQTLSEIDVSQKIQLGSAWEAGKTRHIEARFDKVHRAKTVEEKLDALANAVNELARNVGNVEDKLTSELYSVTHR